MSDATSNVPESSAIEPRTYYGSKARPADGFPKMPPRAPAVTIALALSCGIVIDRYFRLGQSEMQAALLVLLPVWLMAFCSKNWRLSAVCLLLLMSIVGALHHQQQWFERRADDIEHCLRNERQLMRVRGHVSGFPTTIVNDTECGHGLYERPPITRFVVELSELKTATGWQSQSACLRVDVDGELDLAPGDSVEIQGWASRFRGPANPGEPDYRRGQQALRIRGILRASNPDLVHVDEVRRSWWSRQRHWLRHKCDAALRSRLQGDSLGAALAFLLGDRSLLSTDIRNAFIETGTMHVLAISGVHLTILAMFMATVCRIIGFGERLVVLVVLGVSMAYLAIADVRPPMTRAFVLIAVWSAEQWLYRRLFSFNGLAVAAVVILLLNPADLFDVGAQLSFLAVTTMIWWPKVESRWLPFVIDRPRSELPSSLVERIWRKLWKLALRTLLLSIVIWLVTVPLVASIFHVISPIGPVINVPLALVATPALWVGFVFVLTSLIHPSLASLFGGVLDFLMQAMLWLVRLAAAVRYGHVYVPAPPEWWLFGIYGVIATLMLLWLYQRRSRWVIAVAMAWTYFGASLALNSPEPSGLRCTFLSVGHGCSVTLETPQGRVLVYDVGCLRSGDVAKRVVSQSLWQRHRRAIDILMVSHADADHFNGVRGLLGTIPVGRLIVSPTFESSQQADAIDALNAARERGVVIETVTADDLIVIEEGIEMRVLHPDAAKTYGSDNSNSLVLEITYAGRRILLTGDLEDDGLRRLLQLPDRSVEIMLAPHHGSLGDNPIELARWAKPRFVIASSGQTVALPKLQAIYGDQTRVLTTAKSGAIEFEMSSSGTVRLKTYQSTDE